MKRRCLPTLFLMALPAASVMAAEPIGLSKLDRTIAKEPKYVAPSQEYCLLVFGPKAETRVWLVRDGDVLYVDRNGNGDLTEPGKAFRKADAPYWFPCGDIISRDGKTTYKGLSVNNYSDGYRLRVDVPGTGLQMVGIGQAEKPRFASRAKDAPIIHFGGPLALTQFSTKRVIPRDAGATNDRNRSLRVMVGTPGLGEGTFAAYNCRVCEGHDHGPMMGKFVYGSIGGPQIEVTEPLEKIG